MDLSNFFEGLLNLNEPYKIVNIERKVADEKTPESVHIYIEVSKDYRPVNEVSIQGIRHDVEPRTWRHLDLFQYICYLHCEVPKFKYGQGKDSYVETLKVPWSRSGSGFTLLFESLVMGLLELHGCVKRVAKQVREYPQRIQTLANFYEPLEELETADFGEDTPKEKEDELSSIEVLQTEVEIKSDELKDVKKLNIDETSRKKGHDYVTNFIDGDTGELLDIQKGKGAKTIERFVKKGLSKGLNPSQITDISIDMSPSFICGCEFYFPQAMISFDKFHVSQLINRCFDEFRKKQGRKLGERLPKWAIVKPMEKLSAKEYEKMSIYLDQLPQLDRFHQHKNRFSELWTYEDPEQGAVYLAFWIGYLHDMAIEFKDKKMMTLTKTLNKHFDRIINVLKSGMDNSISEAFNNNVQIMKRVARGYKKFEQYIQMIKIHCAWAK